MTVNAPPIAEILDLASTARHEEAIALLGSDWPGLAVEPREAIPELLFSVGVLNTNLGLSAQDGRAHEVAKNCLSRAARGLRGEAKNLAEIQLALAYWRSGDEEESLIQLAQIIDRPLSEENRFRALFAYAVVLGSIGRHKEEREALERARPLLPYLSPAFKGRFHAQSGMNFRKEGIAHVDKCLEDYTAALVYYEECGAEILEASARNNLAGVYSDLGDFKQAHAHVERAIEIGTSLGDRGRVAQCHDQQAQIFLKQGYFVRAAQCASDSIRLITTPNAGWAIDSRITFATALARSGDSRSVEEFSIAVQVARRQGNRYKESIAALTALEELDLDETLMLEWLPLAAQCNDAKRVAAVRRRVANKLLALSDYEDVKLAMLEHKGNIHHAARSLGYKHHTGLLPYLKKHPELRLKEPYKRTRR